MLRQAMLARRVLILLDGIDEGGRLIEPVVRHICEVHTPRALLFAPSSPSSPSSLLPRTRSSHRSSHRGCCTALA